MDVMTSPPITVEPIGGDESEWKTFLARSANGTLFHDLRFLRYHPEDRFRFHHLIFKQHGKPIALLPGGLAGTAERPTFCSPLGASIGGFVVDAGLRAQTAVDLVTALQDHAAQQDWAGVEITLPPQCYAFETSDVIEFALFCGGFRLLHRWLCPVLPLADGIGFEQLFRGRQISYVRAAHRKGMSAVEGGTERLDDFLEVFRDTYDRHGVPATHTPEEMRDLLERLPDRARIHLAILGGEVIAGLLVFRLSATVANTFYICSSRKHSTKHGASFVIAELIPRLSGTGCRFLDFGPSASDQKFKKGVTFFKEGLGAFGQCRDRWRWEPHTRGAAMIT
jgi:GNAT acetyltransferase-like protein